MSFTQPNRMTSTLLYLGFVIVFIDTATVTAVAVAAVVCCVRKPYVHVDTNQTNRRTLLSSLNEFNVFINFRFYSLRQIDRLDELQCTNNVPFSIQKWTKWRRQNDKKNTHHTTHCRTIASKQSREMFIYSPIVCGDNWMACAVWKWIRIDEERESNERWRFICSSEQYDSLARQFIHTNESENLCEWHEGTYQCEGTCAFRTLVRVCYHFWIWAVLVCERRTAHTRTQSHEVWFWHFTGGDLCKQFAGNTELLFTVYINVKIDSVAMAF